MTWDIHAVTVTPWYLDKQKYSLKTLKVTRNKKGKLVWCVSTTLSVMNDRSVAMKDAYYIARNKRIPFIPGVCDGDRVSKSHIQTLQNSGVAVDWKL